MWSVGVIPVGYCLGKLVMWSVGVIPVGYCLGRVDDVVSGCHPRRILLG